MSPPRAPRLSDLPPIYQNPAGIRYLTQKERYTGVCTRSECVACGDNLARRQLCAECLEKLGADVFPEAFR